MKIHKSNCLRIVVSFFVLASLLPIMSIATTAIAPNFSATPIAAATEEGDIQYVDEEGNIIEREFEEFDNELARDGENFEDAGYEAIEPISAELDEAGEGIEAIGAELEETEESAGFHWEVLVVIAVLIISGVGAFFFASKKKKDDPQTPQQ